MVFVFVQHTDNDICLGSGLLKDVGILESAMGKLDGWVFRLYHLGTCFVANENGVFVVLVSVVDVIKDRASDVSWLMLVLELVNAEVASSHLPVTPVLLVVSIGLCVS